MKIGKISDFVSARSASGSAVLAGCATGLQIKSHVLRIRIDVEVQKQDIKVRLLKPGCWRSSGPGEEIPVE